MAPTLGEPDSDAALRVCPNRKVEGKRKEELEFSSRMSDSMFALVLFWFA